MTVKVAALVAALGFVTVLLEQPGLTASPSYPRTTVEQNVDRTDALAAPKTHSMSGPATTGDSRLPEYFPGQFAPPSGEVEPQAPTF